MNQRETYEALEMEVITFDAEDVITASDEGPTPSDPYETPII